ncbi:helix-turn-helix domain-containing protein [Actinomadura sp. J1-007]|uniref:helix-turn-helix domain-containing protein n=1 Tax=Actinomadura sp. J1-007 TaxID=2661913 RepID=UPI0013238F7E|nr:helix-turn-helix domain-containing protein [Actinomadura sp. J1-007]
MPQEASAPTPPAEDDPAGGRVLDIPRRGGPTVLRILLGAQLRRLREERQISTEQAGYEIRGSHSKISRMELGRVGFKERDVADLLTLYGVTDPAERAPLLELAREANTPGWSHRYGDVLPSWFEVYLGLEEAASLLRTYELQFVPGLLQTEDYAAAVVRLGFPDASEDEVERRVGLRRTRQERFTAPGAPTLWAVVDEAVVRRPLGGRDVMRAQLRHLIAMSELPNVTLQIVRFGAGGHAAAGGPFTILRFAEPGLSDVVYLEQLTSALYLDKPTDVDTYMRAMNNLCITAARPDDTPGLLTEILNET